MKTTRAGKQQKACWRSEEQLESRLKKELVSHLEMQIALRGHAIGWVAGVAWAKRNIKSKRVAAMPNDQKLSHAAGDVNREADRPA